MAHQTFKVCILVDSNVENFYIKHYIDQINPVFNRFKTQVFQRNPSVNVPNLKIYWIDGEDDQILIACEEDFRLFLEEGKGRKVFFSVSNNARQQQEDPEESMEAENIVEPQQTERKSRKNHKEDEKRCRRLEKLTKKLKHYEDTYKGEEERSRCRHSEKREFKNNERLERAKRRVEQIRTIIGSIDPANLNSSSNSVENVEQPSTSTANEPAATQIPASISPETIRLLSNAIAGCLQPCNVINKVLNEVFAIIPQVMEQTTAVMNVVDQSSQMNVDQQQQTIEVPKNTTATNTSDANTPIPVRQANQEIEQLFKEAAKELEKMNEIVNNNSKMEGSVSSGTSTTGASQVTQIERVFQNISDSAISNATIIDNINESQADQTDGLSFQKSFVDDDFKVATPAKSIRSRESSIEIHDVSSMMSDDSRDWTILSQDELSIEPVAAPRNIDPKTGAVPKGSTSSNDASSQVEMNEPKRDSIKSQISIETQTPTSLIGGIANQEQLQASVQKSIDIVQKSIETIQKTMDNAQKENEVVPKVVETVQPQPQEVPLDASTRRDIYPNLQATAPPLPVQSQANINAANLKKQQANFEPAVVVYDPNPKINASVHTMMNMGFSNEDNWLTQLLINVDGDIPKALNFLTPQPKNRKP